jgi:hypothetical protein
LLEDSLIYSNRESDYYRIPGTTLYWILALAASLGPDLYLVFAMTNLTPSQPTPPPLMRDQRKVDADHLRLLAVFHLIVAGLSLLGIGFLVLHYTFMHLFLDNPNLWKGQKGGPPPAEFFAIFKWFYVVMGGFLVTASLGNLLSGLFIRKRKHRIFSLIVAGFDCIQIPFGTVLGVFTVIVLLRESVRELYDNT